MMVYIIGAGMPDDKSMTAFATKLIEEADIITGSARLLESVKGGETYECVDPEKIAEYLAGRVGESITACVLLSGDALFYSAGARIYGALREKGIEASLIPGVSSVSYFCARLGEPWSDTKLVSAHGRDVSLASQIRDNERIFALLDVKKALELCDKLYYYGMDHVTLHAGVRLSYDDEAVVTFKNGDFKNEELRGRISGGGSLAVILAVNERARDAVFDALEDEAFIRDSATRGKIPMTKRRVRALSLELLSLKRDSVLWDVGAGCGSISIAAALMSPEISVVAVEKDAEAVMVISENRRKFAADNLQVVCDIAPEGLPELPAPTHAFIGGSSGNIGGIIEAIFDKNPAAIIVTNIISLTTLAELERLLGGREDWDAAFTYLSVCEEKRAGAHRLMQAQNPIYIIRITKKC